MIRTESLTWTSEFLNLNFWISDFISKWIDLFFSCKTLSELCLIYVCGLIYLHCLFERWIDSVFPRTFISQSNWHFPLNCWFELNLWLELLNFWTWISEFLTSFLNELTFSFLQIVVWFMIDLWLWAYFLANFVPSMNSVFPRTIISQSSRPLFAFSSGEPKFSTWFLTCTFSSAFLANFVWFMFDLWLWTVNHEWFVILWHLFVTKGSPRMCFVTIYFRGFAFVHVS